MRRAILLAQEAARMGEIPVGAVIIKDGKIVGEGKNQRESRQNALLHAEIEAIDSACRTLGSWRLSGCTLYVTMEPCPMCAGAILNSRIERVVFGAYDENMGACGTAVDLFAFSSVRKPEIWGGILQEECTELLQTFFQNLRCE